MKYWEDESTSTFNDISMYNDDLEAVLSIQTESSGDIRFASERESGYIFKIMSKQDAIKAFEEAIVWIKGDVDV